MSETREIVRRGGERKLIKIIVVVIVCRLDRMTKERMKKNAFESPQNEKLNMTVKHHHRQVTNLNLFHLILPVHWVIQPTQLPVVRVVS